LSFWIPLIGFPILLVLFIIYLVSIPGLATKAIVMPMVIILIVSLPAVINGVVELIKNRHK
jgi:hypothetical protein